MTSMRPPTPAREAARLAELREMAVLDTPREQNFDDLTLVAAQLCKTPVALISLVDEDRQWFKSRIGLEQEATSRDVSFCAHAIVEPSGVLVVPDAYRDARFEGNPLVLADPAIRFYAGAPLVTTAGNALGTLCVIDYEPRKLSSTQINSLQALSRLAVSQLETRREAMTDRLTGLGNRRAVEQQATSELSRAGRTGASLSVAILDVDRFKDVNDRFGHASGDSVLKAVSERAGSVLRGYDSLGRWGGEEFVVLLPDTDLEGAQIVVERVRTAVASTPISLGGDLATSVSLSAGLISVSGVPGLSFDTLLAEADGLLLRAKDQGRDQVVSGDGLAESLRRAG